MQNIKEANVNLNDSKLTIKSTQSKTSLNSDINDMLCPPRREKISLPTLTALYQPHRQVMALNLDSHISRN